MEKLPDSRKSFRVFNSRSCKYEDACANKRPHLHVSEHLFLLSEVGECCFAKYISQNNRLIVEISNNNFPSKLC